MPCAPHDKIGTRYTSELLLRSTSCQWLNLHQIKRLFRYFCCVPPFKLKEVVALFKSTAHFSCFTRKIEQGIALMISSLLPPTSMRSRRLSSLLSLIHI